MRNVLENGRNAPGPKKLSQSGGHEIGNSLITAFSFSLKYTSTSGFTHCYRTMQVFQEQQIFVSSGVIKYICNFLSDDWHRNVENGQKQMMTDNFYSSLSALCNQSEELHTFLRLSVYRK